MQFSLSHVVVCKLNEGTREGTTVCLTIQSYLNQMCGLRAKVKRKECGVTRDQQEEEEEGHARLSLSFLSDDHRMVIVDEATMVDSTLMLKLLQAIPDRAHIVLLGDLDQLSSIGAGAVLREAMLVLPTTRLTKVYRQQTMEGGIQQALKAVLNGNALPPARFEFSATRYSPQDLEHKVRQQLTAYPTTKFLMWTNVLKVQVNTMLQRLLNPPDPEKAEIWQNKDCFRVGDRVMCTQNQDRLKHGIANGTLGRVTDIRPFGGGGERMALEVQFDNMFLQSFEFDMVRDKENRQTVKKPNPSHNLPLILVYIDCVQSSRFRICACRVHRYLERAKGHIHCSLSRQSDLWPLDLMAPKARLQSRRDPSFPVVAYGRPSKRQERHAGPSRRIQKGTAF